MRAWRSAPDSSSMVGSRPYPRGGSTSGASAIAFVGQFFEHRRVLVGARVRSGGLQALDDL
eukprot:1507747-Pyramimonas_sp.AAC.1